MRVKVGDTWYAMTEDQPIMVELTPADKENIANMAPEATCYALFDNGSMTAEEMQEWMARK